MRPVEIKENTGKYEQILAFYHAVKNCNYLIKTIRESIMFCRFLSHILLFTNKIKYYLEITTNFENENN